MTSGEYALVRPPLGDAAEWAERSRWDDRLAVARLTWVRELVARGFWSEQCPDAGEPIAVPIAVPSFPIAAAPLYAGDGFGD